MTTYYEDFSGFTVGDGWTEISGTWTYAGDNHPKSIVSNANADSGKAMRVDATTFGIGVSTLSTVASAISSNGGMANVEVYGKFQVATDGVIAWGIGAQNGTGVNAWGVLAKGSPRTPNLFSDDDAGTGASFLPQPIAGATAATDIWHFWFKVSSDETEIQGKAWKDGDSEPTASTASLSAAPSPRSNIVGLYNRGNVTEVDVLFLGWGFDGDAAPRSAAPAGISGTASGTFPLTGSATGTVAVAGAASGTLPLTGSATGAVAVTGAASGTLPLTGTATGAVAVTGAASGTLPLTGAATGTVAGVITGAASGALPLTGTAAGTVAVAGAGSGALPLTGAATGAVAVTGAGAGTLPLTGAATGTARDPGELFASGTLPLTGSAAGTVALVGVASGTLPLTGSATGVAVQPFPPLQRKAAEFPLNVPFTDAAGRMTPEAAANWARMVAALKELQERVEALS